MRMSQARRAAIDIISGVPDGQKVLIFVGPAVIFFERLISHI
jgi:hypothetical protein